MHIPRQVASIPNDNLLDLVTVTLGSSRKSLNPVGHLLQNYGMYKMALEIKQTFKYVQYFLKHKLQYICVI
jgi:hypothetical protein